MNEKLIQEHILHYYFPRGVKHMCTNYAGTGFHECDVIGVNPSGLTIEYEIKISRSDFKNDIKKRGKHLRMVNPTSYARYRNHGTPNRFYYVTPVGLIKPEEVPTYTGLIYVHTSKKVGESIEVIKRAPLIHNNKHGEKLLDGIAQSLTAKLIYGCSYMNWQRKQPNTYIESQPTIKGLDNPAQSFFEKL